MADTERLTPMMRQYLGWKEKYPDCILFFRMGDFYETFQEDAKIVARELDITLTARDKDRSLPMAGVPWHAVEGYLSKLVKKGYRIAICEQMTQPDGRTLVDRQVVRVVTPGTFLPEESDESPQLAALLTSRDQWYLAYLAPSDPKVQLTSGTPAAIINLLDALRPAELLVPRGKVPERLPKDWRLLELPTSLFEPRSAYQSLMNRWGLSTLRSFGLEEPNGLVAVAHGLLSYLDETSFSRSGHVTGLTIRTAGDVMSLEGGSLIHLDLVGKESLNSYLDCCKTPGGRILLQRWIMFPSRDRATLARRHDNVGILIDSNALERFEELLSDVRDVKRSVARLHSGLGTPKDLAVLRDSLAVYPQIAQLAAEILPKLSMPSSEETAELGNLLITSLLDPVPRVVGSGALIAPGVDSELDKWRKLNDDGSQWLEEFTEREKDRLGATRLKVSYNRVFGYSIEISKSQLESITLPDEYTRRQTLATAERFVSPELAQFEQDKLRAESSILAIENRWFDELVSKSLEQTEPLQALAEATAELDCLLAFARRAKAGRWVRPEFSTDGTLHIQGGRHPLVEERLRGEPFVPFELMMRRNRSTGIVTGPNMAGKSTILRSLGTIAVLAQMGSYVPATSATLPLFDKLFTRVGARDELMKGNSTFMVEMVETAHILQNATEDSLVILDEVGRGTSTYDGMSIAWAVLEFLAEIERRPLALFATHYHELTALTQRWPTLFNVSMDVVQGPKGPIFTHRLIDGPASESYGVEVARLAGLPRRVVNRAQEILNHLEGAKQPEQPVQQGALFDLEGDQFIDQIAALDPDGLTPKEALDELYKLHAKACSLRNSG